MLLRFQKYHNFIANYFYLDERSIYSINSSFKLDELFDRKRM